MGRTCDVILAVFILSSLHHESKTACPDAVADVVYVLDASGSVGSTNFAMLLTFVQELVRDLPIGSCQVRVGVETYESTATAEFHLNRYSDQNSVVTAVGNIAYTGGGTNTSGALNFLRTTMFTSANGDRPGVPNIGIVITDGQSSGTAPAADACRNAGIVLFAVGVGTGVPRAELEAIANQPYDKHVFIANSYSQLDPIKKSIRDMICQTAVSTCPPEPVIANSARSCTNSSNPGSVCTYTCNTGYELDGNSRVTCQSSLQWSALPSCQRIHCPFPVIPNSQRTCTNSDWYGSVCTYTCLTGYELQGSSAAQCLASKLWSNQPSCPKVQCPYPVIPNSQRVCTNTNRYRSMCTYTCDSPGYELQGNPSAQCKADKTWTSQPSCPMIQCPGPVTVANSQVACTNSNWWTSVCTYTCDVGYEIAGNPDVTCRADKTWTDLPSCPESCSWVRHHCWPGDCGGNYAANCVCRPGFSKKSGGDELCDLDTEPEVPVCPVAVTSTQGNVYHSFYLDPTAQCGDYTETWIQADPQEVRYTIHVEFNLTVGDLANYTSDSEVGIVGAKISLYRVNVSGFEFPLQTVNLTEAPECQHNVSDTSPLSNGSAFICTGSISLPRLNLAGGESLCMDIEGYSGGFYRLQDEALGYRGEHLYTRRASSVKRICFFRDCPDGWYTRTCDVECTNCDVTGSCDRETGACDYGCSPGWIVGNFTHFCNTTCPDYTYGKNCQLECGKCWNSASCRHDNGTCEQGCAEDYGGDLCKRWTGTDPTLAAALGSILGLAILGALGLLLYFIIKRKSGKKLKNVSSSPESSPPTTPRTVSNVDVGMTPTPPPFTPVPPKSSVLSDPVFAYVPSPNPATPKPSAVNITEVASAPTPDAQPTPKTPSPTPKTPPQTQLPPQKEKKTPRPDRPRPTERETQSPKDDVPKCLLMFKKHTNCTRPCCAGPTNCQCPIHITR